MPRGYKNSPAGLPTGPGTLMEMCDGDEAKVLQIQRMVRIYGFDNLEWVADALEWMQSMRDTLSDDEIADELYRRMPPAVRARLADYYGRHPEELEEAAEEDRP